MRADSQEREREQLTRFVLDFRICIRRSADNGGSLFGAPMTALILH